MATKNKHKALRITGLVVFGILLAVTGFGFWFSRHYKPILMERIPGWVAKATDSLYKVSVGDANINIFTRRVTVTNVNLWLDTNQLAKLRAEGRAPHVFYSASIPVIQAKGIEWANLAADKEIKCKSLVVLDPELVITSFPETPADSLHRVSDSLVKAYEDKKPSIDQVYVNQIILTHPHLTYQSTDSAGRVAKLSVNEGSIMLNDFEINPGKPKDSSRFFFAKTAVINIDSIEYKKDKFLYNITANSIKLVTDSNRLVLSNFSLKSNVSREDFYSITGHQNDMFTMSFPSVSIDGFDWKRLLNDKTIAIESISLRDPVLEDYFTRLAPGNPESKKGRYPNQLIGNMKQKLDIRSVKISNGHFKYTEVNEKTKLAGVLNFDGIDGSVSNATNLPEQVSKNSACIIKLNGQFMKSSPIHATFNLSLSDPGGAFTVDGGMTDLDAAQINGVARALAVTEIESVHISKLDLHVSGDESKGQGTVTMLYSNLKVVPQKVDDDTKKLEDNSFLSFLTNNLIIYPDNPMSGEPVRTESSYVPRDEHKSFFNLIWKCIFNSVQKTAIRSDNIEKTLEDKQNKKDVKKGFIKRLFGGKDKAKDDKKKGEPKDDKKKKDKK